MDSAVYCCFVFPAVTEVTTTTMMITTITIIDDEIYCLNVEIVILCFIDDVMEDIEVEYE